MAKDMDIKFFIQEATKELRKNNPIYHEGMTECSWSSGKREKNFKRIIIKFSGNSLCNFNGINILNIF